MVHILPLILSLIAIFYIILIYFYSNYARSSEKVTNESDKLKIAIPASTTFTLTNTLSRKTKVLYCIAAGTVFDRIDVLEEQLDNALDWCESGIFQVKVIVDTFDTSLDVLKLTEYLQRHRLCSNDPQDLSISILVHKQEPYVSNNKAMPAEVEPTYKPISVYHRQHFQEYISTTDVFIFTENDIGVRLAALKTWYTEVQRLRSLSIDYLIPLMRYENSQVLRRKNGTPKRIKQLRPEFQWDRRTAEGKIMPRSRVIWELTPDMVLHLNHTNAPYLTKEGYPDNYFIGGHRFGVIPYSAASIYSRSQLQELERKCTFLSNQTAYEFFPLTLFLNEFYASLQPFRCWNYESNPTGQGMISTELYSQEFYCCKKWLLPVDHFPSLVVHHVGTPGLGENKWANRHRLKNVLFIDEWTDFLGKS